MQQYVKISFIFYIVLDMNQFSISEIPLSGSDPSHKEYSESALVDGVR